MLQIDRFETTTIRREGRHCLHFMSRLHQNSNSITKEKDAHPDEKEANKCTPTVSYLGAYGFVGWIASFVLYVVFLVWAFIPEPMLHDISFSYYPSKYWAIAIPLFILVTLAFSEIIYIAVNLVITAPLDSRDTVTDDFAVAVPNPGGRCSEGTENLEKSTPHVGDLSLTYINSLMFPTMDHSTVEQCPVVSASSSAVASAAPPPGVSPSVAAVSSTKQ